MSAYRTYSTTFFALLAAVAVASASVRADGVCGGDCAQARTTRIREELRPCCCGNKGDGNRVCGCRSDKQPKSSPETAESSRRLSDWLNAVAVRPGEAKLREHPSLPMIAGESRFASQPSRSVQSLLCVWRL